MSRYNVYCGRCRDVGLPRLTQKLDGLAPSHTIAGWACPRNLRT
jgi:hypothetical protein